MNLDHRPPSRATADPPAVRWGLTLLALLILTVFIIVPVVLVFVEAFADGAGRYFSSLIDDPVTRGSILTTLTVAPVAVACNLAFGLAAAWAIARFRFPGRTLLVTLIDLPFSVSPVVAGLVFVLLFGLQGYFGRFLLDQGVRVIFALPGLILATTFVTLPFVARELIPVMEAIGAEEDVAAVSLGANGWQTFWYVTLPNIKWGLLYGVILCNARAMGEYGAVQVVMGRVEGRSQTIPLRVEALMQAYKSPESFALASVLTLLALATLLLKVYLERRVRAAVEAAPAVAPSESA